ncbi:hypothetical protein [Pseudogemmobacter sp. W21_MBD1_M6]|uniref:hypothetical protein n=1 Tax=Pseudogemmobacter sp. W21_MBD1_M6 TaxID=3240271 RepID=UPI003F9E92D7
MTGSIPKSWGKLCLALFIAVVSPAIAQDQTTPMSEADMRSMLPFGTDDTLKYAVCETKSYPTCTYVWGVADSYDAVLIKAGSKPDGNRLTTVFAKASTLQDFDRVLATYTDAEPLADLGVKAVWSEKRHQLSLLTSDYLVVHVNVDAQGVDDRKATAARIATFLLGAK